MAQLQPNINANRIYGHIDLNGSTAGDASLRVRIGMTPSSPFDGDIWYNGINLVGQLNGTYSILNGTKLDSTQIAFGTGTGITSSSNLIFDNKGIQYGLDYSDDYINRSLVDKQYVDNKTNVGQYNIAIGATSGIEGDSNLSWNGDVIKILGGTLMNVSTYTIPTTLSLTDHYVLANDDITLPKCANELKGIVYIIKNISPSNVVHISTDSGDTIDQYTTTYILNPLGGMPGMVNAITLFCDGTQWFIDNVYILN